MDGGGELKAVSLALGLSVSISCYSYRDMFLYIYVCDGGVGGSGEQQWNAEGLTPACGYSSFSSSYFLLI